jgi:hypothetical protein
VTTVKRAGDPSLDDAAVLETGFNEIRGLFVSNSASADEYAVGIASSGPLRMLDVLVVVGGGAEAVGLRGWQAARSGSKDLA